MATYGRSAGSIEKRGGIVRIGPIQSQITMPMLGPYIP